MGSKTCEVIYLNMTVLLILTVIGKIIEYPSNRFETVFESSMDRTSERSLVKYLNVLRKV